MRPLLDPDPGGLGSAAPSAWSPTAGAVAELVEVPDGRSGSVTPITSATPARIDTPLRHPHWLVGVSPGEPHRRATPRYRNAAENVKLSRVYVANPMIFLRVCLCPFALVNSGVGVRGPAGGSDPRYLRSAAPTSPASCPMARSSRRYRRRPRSTDSGCWSPRQGLQRSRSRSTPGHSRWRGSRTRG